MKVSDFTRNLVVVGRQPHPDPNFASYVSSGRPHRLAVAHSACRLRPFLVPSLTSCSPDASGSHLLLCCFGYGFFWHLRAPLLLPLLPLNSYTTCPLPLCVVIAPFFLACISFCGRSWAWPLLAASRFKHKPRAVKAGACHSAAASCVCFLRERRRESGTGTAR